ncbi:hypothetical protein Riv7116_4985 [Rivularia sp. PCC 7116]|uniref:Mov34/MPN/PAD-1 family protein n=1 Tax=Rivularia sp. PCC 7116 TaxID=373994 RepID=UPI00029ED6FE|nr:Mov34/MPN/PAD-1 family protein [Rivularia sp. PCC 7116]AFY57391.1 hypothetical protein Riv7116_4985 [Rivularia sp. PCC 7116]
MQVLLPNKIAQKLMLALKKAGSREIGGILMGEHIADDVYRVKDLTIQNHGGTSASFVRTIQGIINPLKHFFRKTGYDFTRFNYLGEWHSHPDFATEPSYTDNKTMWEVVEDQQVGANFVILLIVRLNTIGELEGTTTVYLPGQQSFKCELIKE